MEGLTLLLGLPVVLQELLAEELRPVEPYLLYTLLDQRDDHCWYLIAMTFSHHFPFQQLGSDADPFVLNASNNITLYFFSNLYFFFHGLHYRQVSTCASYFRGVPSRIGKPRNPMNELCHDGNGLFHPQVPIMHQAVRKLYITKQWNT